MPTTPSSRKAILAPGRNYGPDGPLLMFARLAVTRRGGTVDPVTWRFDRDADFAEQREFAVALVRIAVEASVIADPTRPLIIGKSLGSLAAGVAADHGLAAVWFTPLLTDPATVAALRRATGPLLLVGGTADQLWDGEVARSLTPHVVEVDGADHGMFVPGRLGDSAAVLGRVVTAVEDFLDHQVWPEQPASDWLSSPFG
jgi:hypothetical protein